MHGYSSDESERYTWRDWWHGIRGKRGSDGVFFAIVVPAAWAMFAALAVSVAWVVMGAILYYGFGVLI